MLHQSEGLDVTGVSWTCFTTINKQSDGLILKECNITDSHGFLGHHFISIIVDVIIDNVLETT